MRCECGFFFLEQVEKTGSSGAADVRRRRRDRILKKVTVVASTVLILTGLALYFTGFLRAEEGSDRDFEPLSLLSTPVALPTAAPNPRFPQNNVSYRVTRIFTGRTIGVTDSNNVEHRVTICGIRAPKMDEDFGPDSRDFLASLVADKSVVVKWRGSTKEEETIAELLVDGSNIGLEQIRQGMASLAVDEIAGLTPEEQQQYLETEKVAKSSKIGIWRNSRGVKPLSNEHATGAVTESGRPQEQRTLKNGWDPAAAGTNVSSKGRNRNARPGSMNTEKEPVPLATDNVSAPPASGNKYILGPRGGCYYITPSGGKSYVDRSMCN